MGALRVEFLNEGIVTAGQVVGAPRGTEGLTIGVFDSGVGGLTVAAALRRRLPDANLLYLGDTARLPYGNKSAETVLRYTQRNVEFLSAAGVDGVVVACNSASALALPSLDSPVPLWGVVEPGARAAAGVARQRVGVIATTATIASAAYGTALERLRPELEILQVACPLFVPLVEEGWLDDEVTRDIARRYLKPLIAARIDTLVLGCTHYPLLSEALRAVLAEALGSSNVTLVDSAAEVSRAVAQQPPPTRQSLKPERGVRSALRICVTDRTPEFERLAERILEAPVDLELVEVV